MRKMSVVLPVALVALVAALAVGAPASASSNRTAAASLCTNVRNSPSVDSSGTISFYGASYCDEWVDRLETTVSVVRNGREIASRKFVCVRAVTYCDGTATYQDDIVPQEWCTYVTTVWWSARSNGAITGPKNCEVWSIP